MSRCNAWLTFQDKRMEGSPFLSFACNLAPGHRGWHSRDGVIRWPEPGPRATPEAPDGETGMPPAVQS